MWVFLAKNSQFWTWWAFLCDFALLLLDLFVPQVHLFKRLVIYLDLLAWWFCKHHIYSSDRAVSLLILCAAPGTVCPQRCYCNAELTPINSIKHFHSREQGLGLGKTLEKASVGDWRVHWPHVRVPQRNIRCLQHEAGVGIVYASLVFFHVRKLKDELKFCI